jgi:hypothetical protein
MSKWEAAEHSNPSQPSLANRSTRAQQPIPHPDAIPGFASITQDVEAAAALRRAGAPGLVGPPKGQEPEHAHC